MSERRQAVIDLGSNSFRLVVFTWSGEGRGAWWKRTDEIHEAVRVGAGLDASGELGAEPMERALRMLELYAHFCRATGITDVRAVATSAIRDAANQADFLEAARSRTWLEVEVLEREAEARYGYLAAVNSTTLADGVALDIGGGSLQLSRVESRLATRRAVVADGRRAHDGALPGRARRRRPSRSSALRAHVEKKLLGRADWLAGAGTHGGRLVGVGGAVRNLAAAAQAAADAPDLGGVQGVAVTRKQLGALIDAMIDLPAAERGSIKGIKPGRADVILAAALVIDTVMALGEFDAVEATEAGLREGVFFETLLDGTDPPLFDDVRRASVLNLAAQYHPEFDHTEHVAEPDARDVGRAGRRRPAPRRPRRARPAVGGRDAARHRHGGRLRRPPQALALPDPHTPGCRASAPARRRWSRSWPATTARARRRWATSSRSRARATRTCCGAASALLRLAEQLERARDQAVHEAGPDRRRRRRVAAPAAPTRTSRSPAGWPSARPTCSSAPSASALKLSADRERRRLSQEHAGRLQGQGASTTRRAPTAAPPTPCT